VTAQIARTLLGIFTLAPPAISLAASPGVPVLPSTPNNYVGYAVTNLPAQFRTPVLNAADNTPADNPITNAGAELGRVLFYDQRLSHNNGTSCASCHKQENGFSDPATKSVGFEGGLTGRHSMGLANAKFYAPGSFFWDQRAATLEDQVLKPIQDPVEMGMNLTDLVAKMEATDYYPALFEKTYGDRTITTDRISRSLSQFVRSMTSYKSKYDSAFNAQGQPNFVAAFTAQEERGHQLFGTGPGGRCSSCHGTDAQIANQPRNIGLDATNTDEGAGDGEMKVPSLRNIAVRGTFMHDGRFASLREVINHYSTGIQNNPDLDPILRTPNGQPVRFNFTPGQVNDLIAFLNTLTDTDLLTNSIFANPFVTLDGDYNADGVVDDDDYSVWLESFGSTTLLSADGNLDGLVDAADYSLWRDNRGRSWRDLQGTLAVANSQAVPEPTSAVALVCAVLLCRFVARDRSPVRTAMP